MSHIENEFNIKTFDSETIVFRDGVICPQLSTLKNTVFDKTYNKPIHIIYIGNICGENILNIDIKTPHQQIYLSMHIKNNTDAKIGININNFGKNSEFRGQIMIENSKNLTFNCTGIHNCSDTTILVKTKIIATNNSYSKLTGESIILPNTKNTINDISFSAMIEKNAKIEFNPTQRISSVPKSADHSTAINQASDFQIRFLRNAGLSDKEINNITREAFINDFSLF